MSLTSIAQEKADEIVREVAIAEGRLEQANKRNEALAAQVDRLNARFIDDRRMLLVRLDGSTQEKALYAGPDGQPVRTYREAFMSPVSAHEWDRDPRYLSPVHTRTFRLLAQVGSKYVYGEV